MIPTLIAAEVEHPDLRPLTHDPASTLRELGIDSASRAYLAMMIDDALDITLPDDVVQGWDCVADVMACGGVAV